jgi:energy-coupling factor transporter transmembrane protein EcfT
MVHFFQWVTLGMNDNCITEPMPEIEIRPQTNRHGLFLIALGITLFLIVLLIAQFYWREYQTILIFLYLTTFIISFSGILKRLEPPFSFRLSPNKITYHHKYGQWSFSWPQIKRIAVVKETTGLETIALPYIGVKLQNLEQLTKQISPRLANRLIHEQKPLISFAIRHNLMTLSEGVIHFEPYKLSHGNMVSGPLAAFLYHCQALETAFGYHLFIPESSVDRELSSFCTLLSQCQHASTNYQDIGNNSA